MDGADYTCRICKENEAASAFEITLDGHTIAIYTRYSAVKICRDCARRIAAFGEYENV